MSWLIQASSWGLLLGMLAIFGTLQAHAAPPVLSVQLSLEKGMARVNRTSPRTGLDPGDQLIALQKCGLTEAQITNQLLDYLDERLMSIGPLIEAVATYSGTISPVEKTEQENLLRNIKEWRKEKDSLEDRLYKFSGDSWKDFVLLYGEWRSARFTTGNPPRPPSPRLWFQDFFIGPLFWDGPLTPLMNEYGNLAADTLNGILTLKMAPLPDANSFQVRQADTQDIWPEIGPQLQQLLLDRFQCKLWDRKLVAAAASRALEARDYTVDILSPSDINGEDPTIIGMAPPQRLQLFATRPSSSPPSSGAIIVSSLSALTQLKINLDPATRGDDILHALYVLLPTRDWNSLRRIPASYLCKQDAQNGEPSGVLLELRGRNSPPLSLSSIALTPALIARYQQRMQGLGLSMSMKTLIPTINSPPKSDADSLGSPLAWPLPFCDGRADSGKTDIEQPNETNIALRKDKQQRDQSEKYRDSLMLRLDRETGRPWQPTLALSHSPTGSDDIWSMEIGAQDNTSGKFDYAHDFLVFGSLQRRLRISAGVFSTYTPDRPVAAAGLVDERRNGAQVGALLDLWRDGSGGSFGQAQASLTHSNIHLNASRDTGQRLTVLDLGVSVAGSAPNSWRARRWELATTLSLGHASAGSENSADYAKLQLDGLWQQMLGTTQRAMIRARAVTATADTPQTEWPVFGGDQSVRGYRDQSAVARHTWSLQNEYWLPLPLPASWAPSQLPPQIKSSSIALFADGGGLSQGTSSAGARFGAGIGVRIPIGTDAVLQLDWARPIGRSAGLGSRENHFYLTILAYRLP